MKPCAGPACLPGTARWGVLMETKSETTCSRATGSPRILASTVNTKPPGLWRCLPGLDRIFLRVILGIGGGALKDHQWVVDHHVIPSDVPLTEDHLEHML